VRVSRDDFYKRKGMGARHSHSLHSITIFTVHTHRGRNGSTRARSALRQPPAQAGQPAQGLVRPEEAREGEIMFLETEF
jgi:hypothetical protein